METNRTIIHTVGKYSKDYIAREESNLKELQINQFLKGVYDELLDKILLNGYELKVGRCYNVSFKRYQRNFDKLVVDFGASNKIKAEILGRGGKLATRIGTSPYGNPVFDDGELWMVFRTDPYYVSCSFRPDKIKRADGTYNFYSVRYIWNIKQNAKVLKRFSTHENKKLITKGQIELHHGSKNNIL